MNRKGLAGGGITVFLLCVISICVLVYIWANASNDGINYYNSSINTSVFNNLGNNSTLVQLSQDLNNQYSGANSSNAGGGSITDSFSKVYNLGIVTSSIISTTTPGLFKSIFESIGLTLGIDAFYVVMATITVAFLLIGSLLYILIGRNL